MKELSVIDAIVKPLIQAYKREEYANHLQLLNENKSRLAPRLEELPEHEVTFVNGAVTIRILAELYKQRAYSTIKELEQLSERIINMVSNFAN